MLDYSDGESKKSQKTSYRRVLCWNLHQLSHLMSIGRNAGQINLIERVKQIVKKTCLTISLISQDARIATLERQSQMKQSYNYVSIESLSSQFCLNELRMGHLSKLLLSEKHAE